MGSRTTIQDVARQAGVSKVTVSYVLNGRGADARISEATEAKVIQAARDLKYVPSAIAKTLATRRSKSLGVVLQSGEFFSRTSSFTAEVMRGVCAAAVESGYDLMLHTSPVQTPAEELKRLRDGRVDGVLVLRDQGDPLLESLLESSLPCVQFFTRSEQRQANWFDTDNYLGGRMATEHLLSLGHRRIGWVGGPAGSVSARQRRLGYEAAMGDAGLELHPAWRVSMPDPTSSLDGLVRCLTSEERPTALFVWSDDVALSCWRMFSELGLSVPDELSVIGFDSSPACERSSPPLSSVRQPIFDIAFAATEALVRAIENEDAAPAQSVYAPCLDLRGSTAAPAAVPATGKAGLL
jgi:DNA-binding LacI/PurR family transcriptional regulator